MMNSRRPAVFIGSDRCRARGFGSNHPLSIPRVATVLDLCSALGWFRLDEFRSSPQATVDELCTFHRRDYVDALRLADATGQVEREVREHYGIGTSENPLFPGVFAKAATAVGGSMLAAELALDGVVSFHPAGGTHHGRADRASGFCYFNDPVFALRLLAERGLTRILYVDLDAHHGDGVQDAMQHDARVHTISIHESGRWPFTGAADDRGGGRSHNYPVPAGFNDSELEFLMDEAVLPYADDLQPEAIVITCGTDALAHDPLSGLMLSNTALWRAVEALIDTAPAAIVLGGGGYNPWTLARCWTGLWGRLSGRQTPASLPRQARSILEALACDLIDDDEIHPAWVTTLADAPREGPVREAVRKLVAHPAPRPEMAEPTGSCQ
jgi:acetoin utilization protein AcuC